MTARLLVLLALAASCASAAPPPGAAVDAAIGLEGVMERAAARVEALDALSSRLEDLTALYAGAPPPAGTARQDLRREAEAEERRVHEALSEYWHLAETVKVMEAASVIGRAARHKAGLVDAGKTARLMGTPMFPAFVKASRTRVKHALEREERAYTAALKREGRKRLERRIAAGAFIFVAAVAAVLAFPRRGPAERVLVPARRRPENEPPRLT